MLDELSEYEYYAGKRPDKTYVSKRIEVKSPTIENGIIMEKKFNIRYASKVIDTNNGFEFVKLKNEIQLRVSGGERHEITAKFLEDSRGIYVLQIQKFTTATGAPHKTHFSFRKDEIIKLYNFIKSIPNLHIESSSKFSVNDDELNELNLSKQQAYSIYRDNKELFSEILQNNITANDVQKLLYKKAQLDIFEKLLYDVDFFNNEKVRLNFSKDESLWQNFFENNTWIFGYGLEYVINIPLQAKKLEQVVEGFDVVHRGKRVDALMKSKGIVSSLCFAEIKTHNAGLIGKEYRPAVFPPSIEVVGGISQIQKTVQSSLENLGNRIAPTDISGNPTGEEIFMYKPKSFLLIGKLDEFQTPTGLNESKFSSFELYRKSIKDIEIITFDELLERARFIVHSDETKV